MQILRYSNGFFLRKCFELYAFTSKYRFILQSRLKNTITYLDKSKFLGRYLFVFILLYSDVFIKLEDGPNKLTDVKTHWVSEACLHCVVLGHFTLIIEQQSKWQSVHLISYFPLVALIDSTLMDGFSFSHNHSQFCQHCQ